MAYLAGVDIGKNGAFVICDVYGKIVSVVLPVYVGKDCDYPEWSRQIKHDCYSYNIDHVNVEQVGASPQMGAVSAFNFGASYGAVLGIFGLLGVKVKLIRPQTWKAHYGLIGKDKSASIDAAIKMHTDNKNFIRFKKDDGIAEALLIAKYY